MMQIHFRRIPELSDEIPEPRSYIYVAQMENSELRESSEAELSVITGRIT